jgi:hypothetical protein
LAGQKLAFIGQKVPVAGARKLRNPKLCGMACLVAALPLADSYSAMTDPFPNCEIEPDFTI